VRLSDGVSFLVYAEFWDFRKAAEQAIRRNEVIEVVNDVGLRRMMNPQQIVYLEEV
jgi:hypothetical protein